MVDVFNSVNRFSTSDAMITAGNPETSPEILAELATSVSYVVLEAVISNPNVSGDTLTMLAGNKAWNVRSLVASRDRIPVEVQKILAGDELWLIRMEAADNKTAAPDVLLILCEDDDDGVKAAACENSNLPSCKLEEIVAAGCSTQKFGALGNPNITAEQVQRLGEWAITNLVNENNQTGNQHKSYMRTQTIRRLSGHPLLPEWMRSFIQLAQK